MARQAVVLVVLAALLAFALIMHIGIGSHFWYRPWDILAEVLRGPMADPTPENNIVWAIRLPRALLALLVGVTLGLVGSAFQAQLRNPLADPFIVGVSSGSAVGGALALVLGFGTWLGGLGMMAAGFVTGMASLALVYAISYRRGWVDVTTLLLAGVAIGSMLSALTSMVLLLAGEDTNMVLNWLMGRVGSATWEQVSVLAVLAGVGAILLISQTRRLNAFAIGEDTASRLGVDVPRLRSVVLAAGTAMTAATVGAAGIIGFLGLVSPHISRRIVGADFRWSLPVAGLIGGTLLLLADILAQRGLSAIAGIPGLEVPVGLLTAIIGAPSLLILLRRQR